MSHAVHSPAPSSPAIGSSIGTPTQSIFDTPAGAHLRDDASSFTTAASLRSRRIDEEPGKGKHAAAPQHRSLLSPRRAASARPERRSSSSLPASWSAPVGLAPDAPRLAPKRGLSRSPSPLGDGQRREAAPEQPAAAKRHHRKAQRPSIPLSDAESAAPFGGSVYNDVPSFRHFRGPPFDDLSPETSVDMHMAPEPRRERRGDAVKFTHPWQESKETAQRNSGGSAVSPRQVHSGIVQPSRSSRLAPQARDDLSDDDDDSDAYTLDDPVPRRTQQPRPPQLSMLTDASGRFMEPADDSSGLEDDDRVTAERKPSLPMPRDAELLTDSDSDGSSPAAAAISRYLNEKPRGGQRRAPSRQHAETAEAFEVAALRRQVEQLQMCLTQRGQLSPEVLRAAVSPVPEERRRKRDSQLRAQAVPSSSAYREPPSARHAARSPRPVRDAVQPAKDSSRRAQREDAMRIQDLAQKIEQLEALFRHSAMSPVGERSRTAASMVHHSFSDERDVETPRASVFTPAGRLEQRHHSVDGRATEREAVAAPKRKVESRSKTVRLASSSMSIGEHSGAESAFHYNPTPYSINQLAPGRAGSATGAASVDGALRRKKGTGVARFILGATSARRADGSTGEAAPLATTKMKRAGRGGLVAVSSPEQKRVPL
ncbi:hypothetical protein FA09DRAFT_39 [Tilletiopsis washingtonensis]|uniref:Uncharacterized protein n=1 Tax=Tilletiopsis washingtonensis TaxID=58919 RepID=A0A316ZJ11_9BASI|nr:hypothetical protein FA09DRAFT_39 [Tilletiopsis washingtonensis]PWO01035.1 hypothetical protein FA09DRAFT_39 [Tilletiopsis washingtonensis]